MRNSKILRIICYITIPILFLILGLSVFYEIEVREYNDYYLNSDYFNTDGFLSSYMRVLSGQTRNLIYSNNYYNSIMDDEKAIRVCYSGDYINDITDFYYIVIYKDLALTNVELTTNTNSVEKIKNYIKDFDGKKADIINGYVSADSEIINTKALQYFDDFIFNYYSVVEDENVISNYNASDEELKLSIETPYESFTSMKKYYTTNIEDLEIYTTYKEELVQRRYYALYEKFIKFLENYDFIAIPAIPICSISLLMIGIYLIISIGHTKNKEEIDLNDFDKIPLEIIGFILLCIIGVFVLVMDELTNVVNSKTIDSYFDLWLTALLSIYLVIYSSCIITFITTVKRLKAKCFWRTTITGKIFFASLGTIKKILNKIKNAYIKFKNSTVKMFISWNITARILVAFIGIVLGSILLIFIFRPFGIFLDCFIAFGLLYYITEHLGEYYLIENHLKKMYEGQKIDKLDASKFSKNYTNIITYINNIQNGYQDAIEEGIKSERLKTELITNVSHDIKTPLTSIINYVDLLKKEEIISKKAKEYIDVLDGKSQRLKKLTEDLVEASKASSGSVKLNIERINIVELIKQTTGEFEDKFKEKKLEIVLTLPKEEVFINADSRYMYRIIENLFTNISKYALNSSRVYIDVNSDIQKVKIILKNISKEKLNITAEELIQRFVRGDKSRTTEGSGLGLSISQSLTELQNGIFKVSVDGDLFKVELEFDIV